MIIIHECIIQEHLKNSNLFNEASNDQISIIAKGTKAFQRAKGKPIFNRGDPCTGYHILVSGLVKLTCTSAQGTEKIVKLIRQGQSFGEAMMFIDKPYIVSAHALSHCLLLHISKLVVATELERDFSIMRKMLASLASRTHQLLLDIESYSLSNGRQRFIEHLFEQLENPYKQTKDIQVVLSINKKVIASRLSLTQEHFSRILHELSDLDLIRVDGRIVTIPDLKRLNQHRYE